MSDSKCNSSSLANLDASFNIPQDAIFVDYPERSQILIQYRKVNKRKRIEDSDRARLDDFDIPNIKLEHYQSKIGRAHV